MKRPAWTWVFRGIVLAFFLLSTAYSVWVPIWEAPDEVAHFDFIASLTTGGYRLPFQDEHRLTEAHQPPLYYALAAPIAGLANLDNPVGRLWVNPMFSWSGQGGNEVNLALHGTAQSFPYEGWALAIHLARMVSVVLGTATVAFTLAIARLVFPRYPALTALAGSLVAFNPQFLFISGAINNDNLLILAGTVAFWQTLRILRHPGATGLWLGLGAWLGIAVLTKVSGFAVVGACGLAILLQTWRRRSWSRLPRRLVTLALPFLGISGWWFVRNQIFYGDPLGMGVYERIYWMNQRIGPPRLGDFAELVRTEYRSFWGHFGWTTLTMPTWFYLAVGLLLAISVGGVILAWRKGSLRRLTGYQRTALLFLALAAVTQQVFILYTITRCNQSCYQGRYLFPAIAPLGIWLAVGIAGPRRERPVLALVVAGLMLAGGLYAGVGVIQPAFGPVPEPKWRLWRVPPTEITFGEQFRLRGYGVRVEGSPARRVTATLYWERLDEANNDYAAFTHLSDQSGRMIAQADQVPGLDRDYPPLEWVPGDVLRDDHVMDLPAGLEPGRYTIWVGIYNWETGDRLAATGDAGHAAEQDAVVLAEIEIQ